MRERTPLHRRDMHGERLPKLKLICSTGKRNASIDSPRQPPNTACRLHAHQLYLGHADHRIRMGIDSCKRTPHGRLRTPSLRAGGWQLSVGDDLAGKTLGIIGLGNIGSQVARVALAFDMQVIAWSQNLTAEAAQAAGARRVTKEELLRDSDIVTIHLVLSQRTRALISAAEFALMKPDARLVNTSRGPIVVEAALIEALSTHRIAGAAIDVFDVEPLPPGHAFRRLPNLLATPHIGYVTHDLYRRFYGDTVTNLLGWLTGPR